MITLPAKPLVRWRAWVIAAWTALAVFFAPRAAHVQRVLDIRGTSIHPPESGRAAALVQAAFPHPFAEYLAIVVQGPVPTTTRRFQTVLDSVKAAAALRPYIAQVVNISSLGDSELLSRDPRTTLLVAALDPAHSDDGSGSFIPDFRATLAGVLARVPGAHGFDAKVTGDAALDYDVRTISAEDTSQSEARALPLTLIVLVVAFGALVAAALPLIVGVLAITIALGLVTIAAHFQVMSVFVLNITTMVGLGVGIDYSLLVVTRFREELNRGLAPVDAAVRTVETAGSAVVTSGLIVMVGFLGLCITTPMTDTRSVGTGGLIVVGVAVLLATTFLPAVLAVIGRGIDRPKWLARPLARFHTPAGWERWARWLGHRPWRAVALGGAAIALLTSPIVAIRLGIPSRNWFPPQSESAAALAELRAMGASGVVTPIRIVIQFPEGESALSVRRLSGLKLLSDSLALDPRVKLVRGVASLHADMSRLQLAIFYSDPAAARAEEPQFFDAYLSADNRTTWWT